MIQYFLGKSPYFKDARIQIHHQIKQIIVGSPQICRAKSYYSCSCSSSRNSQYGPRYAWSAYEQSLVIGSYFWGVVVTTFIAGVLAERYGARKVVGVGLTAAAILSGVTPVAANYLWLSIGVRFGSGMAMATISPSMQSLISNWAPPNEKGKFLSAYMANGLGTVIDWSMSGFIIEYYGWHYGFYVVVLILGVYAAAWHYIVYDSPKVHPRISTEEKEFILSKVIVAPTKKPWPPIKSMMLSVPFWALTIFHFGLLFSLYVFLTAAPKYLSDVHHFDIAATGVLSSIPYIARFIFAIGFGFLGDFMFKRKLMSA
ncbi:sialin-like, partial [Bradysia coprophila]|uniref:sialin-like n=1 Tax=Bradysia coprophila TaxID=38358 RepID=UPI00187DCA0C